MSANTAADKDQYLHNALRVAWLAKRLTIHVDFAALNHSGSPVYSAVDNVVPLIVMLTAGFAMMLWAGVIEGMTAMTLAVLVQIFGVRLWVANRLTRRVIDEMLVNAQTWQAMWNTGAVAMTLKDVPDAGCHAPAGDWRGFAKRYLPVHEGEPEY